MTLMMSVEMLELKPYTIKCLMLMYKKLNKIIINLEINNYIIRLVLIVKSKQTFHFIMFNKMY